MPRVLARLDFVEKRVRALSTSAANASKAGNASVGAVSASKATQAMVLQNKHAVAELKRFASHPATARGFAACTHQRRLVPPRDSILGVSQLTPGVSVAQASERGHMAIKIPPTSQRAILEKVRARACVYPFSYSLSHPFSPTWQVDRLEEVMRAEVAVRMRENRAMG